MMLNDPTLSIGIVTYNGQFLLKQVLETAAEEIADKNVELIISDNASTDDTQNIINDFKLKHPNIVYVRNSENIGFDANVDQVVRLSKGQFVWLMSDDDFIRKGGIDKVLEVIGQHPDLCYVFVNYTNPLPLKVQKDTICLDWAQFLHDVNFKNGLISSNVVNRRLWSELNMMQYNHCAWIHLAYALQALAPRHDRKGYIIVEEFVKQDGIQRWGEPGAFIDLNLKLLRLLKEIDDLGYDKTLGFRTKIKQMANDFQKGYRRDIPWAKNKGMKNCMGRIGPMKEFFGSFPNFWLVDVPMLLTPNIIYRIGFEVVHKIQNK
ncbi:MAG TPA: glycosyltransferase family 2 protein [Methanomassiliicoccales archaeon]|jgi:glycosyltransferase involved in cell wall biosynthesis